MVLVGGFGGGEEGDHQRPNQFNLPTGENLVFQTGRLLGLAQPKPQGPLHFSFRLI